MLRLLANENMPLDVVAELRKKGFDVLWVRTDFPGASDEVVLARALAENRILITFDKDFGELVYRKGLSGSCGVVLFRIRTTSPQNAVVRIVNALVSRQDWAGYFSVIENDRIRMTKLS